MRTLAIAVLTAIAARASVGNLTRQEWVASVLAASNRWFNSDPRTAYFCDFVWEGLTTNRRYNAWSGLESSPGAEQDFGESDFDQYSEECRRTLFPIGATVKHGSPVVGSDPSLGHYYVTRPPDRWAQVPGMSCDDERLLFDTPSISCGDSGHSSPLSPPQSSPFGVSEQWVAAAAVPTIAALRAALTGRNLTARIIEKLARGGGDNFAAACSPHVAYVSSVWGDEVCAVAELDGVRLAGVGDVAAAITASAPAAASAGHKARGCSWGGVCSPELAVALVHLNFLRLGEVDSACFSACAPAGCYSHWDAWAGGDWCGAGIRAARTSLVPLSRGEAEVARRGDASVEERVWLVQVAQVYEGGCVPGSLEPELTEGVVYRLERDGRASAVAYEQLEQRRKY